VHIGEWLLAAAIGTECISKVFARMSIFAGIRGPATRQALEYSALNRGGSLVDLQLSFATKNPL